jgi:hypothetical protein
LISSDNAWCLLLYRNFSWTNQITREILSTALTKLV